MQMSNLCSRVSCNRSTCHRLSQVFAPFEINIYINKEAGEEESEFQLLHLLYSVLLKTLLFMLDLLTSSLFCITCSSYWRTWRESLAFHVPQAPQRITIRRTFWIWRHMILRRSWRDHRASVRRRRRNTRCGELCRTSTHFQRTQFNTLSFQIVGFHKAWRSGCRSPSYRSGALSPDWASPPFPGSPLLHRRTSRSEAPLSSGGESSSLGSGNSCNSPISLENETERLNRWV